MKPSIFGGKNSMFMSWIKHSQTKEKVDASFFGKIFMQEPPPPQKKEADIFYPKKFAWRGVGINRKNSWSDQTKVYLLYSTYINIVGCQGEVKLGVPAPSVQFNSICLLFQSTKIQFRNKSDALVYQHISAWDQFILSFGIRLGGLFGPYLDDQQH